MMSHAHKQFLFAVLVGFALAALVHSQNQSGFISIDCGLPNNSGYTETTTGINYISDSTFIDTGESKYLSANHDLNYYQPYWYVRSFPQGVRNCYKINVTYGTKYLIRAGFQYGNYDGENKPPGFELHLGANLWDKVNFSTEFDLTTRELIHVTLQDYIHICLVNTNKGVPFISSIELRPLLNTSYKQGPGFLALVSRYDTGLSTTNDTGSSRDLSNNDLTAPIPDFLSQMPDLYVLNLGKNKLAGPVPAGLIDRNKYDGLSLSLCENPNISKLGHISCKSRKKQNVVIPVVVSIIGTMFLLLTAAAIWWRCKSEKKDEPFKVQGRKFTKSEIDKITSNSTLIGRGGYGEVYHGTLEKDTQVAMKILNLSSRQGSKEFQNEVKLLMRVHHRNLVSFIGYCDEGDTMALVYEYVGNGNLQQQISAAGADIGLTWKQRLQIAVDTARGLEYLHDGCKPPILHRDLKPSNILLNETLQAKIADFGISKALATETATHALTDLRGTYGYLDPQYCTTGQLTRKSDAYSFGIVLLELITGRPAIITDVEPVHVNVSDWVRAKFERIEIESIVDSRVQGTYKYSSAQTAIETALACVSKTPTERPEISYVYDRLKECLEIEKVKQL